MSKTIAGVCFLLGGSIVLFWGYVIGLGALFNQQPPAFSHPLKEIADLFDLVSFAAAVVVATRILTGRVRGWPFALTLGSFVLIAGTLTLQVLASGTPYPLVLCLESAFLAWLFAAGVNIVCLPFSHRLSKPTRTAAA